MSKARFTGGVWGLEYGLVVIGGIHYELDNAYDAPLIAAAPEMYATLELTKRLIETMDLCDPDLYDLVDKNIDPLLAKARGKNE